MNGLCPWLWAPTFPQRWKPTIRLSLYVPPFQIYSPINDSYRPNKISQKSQVSYSVRVSPMKFKASYRCWPELGTDSHRILGHRSDQRRTILGWYFVEILPQIVSYTLENVLCHWLHLLSSIQWARKYGLRIYLDLHALPGSQNGWVSLAMWQPIILLHLCCRIIPERVRICFLTFVQGAWNWQGSPSSFFASLF